LTLRQFNLAYIKPSYQDKRRNGSQSRYNWGVSLLKSRLIFFNDRAKSCFKVRNLRFYFLADDLANRLVAALFLGDTVRVITFLHAFMVSGNAEGPIVLSITARARLRDAPKLGHQHTRLRNTLR
jgi:hypothetical protein